MAATTPIGSLVVKAQRSVLAGVSPIGISRPAKVRNSSAAFSTPSMARPTSITASVRGLPPLARNLLSKVNASLLNETSEPAQDGDARVRFEPAIPITEGPRGCLELRLERVRIVGRDLGDGRSVERLHDLQHVPP